MRTAAISLAVAALAAVPSMRAADGFRATVKLGTQRAGRVVVDVWAAMSAKHPFVIEKIRDKVQEIIGLPVLPRQMGRAQGGMSAFAQPEGFFDIAGNRGVECRRDRDHAAPSGRHAPPDRRRQR